MKSAAAKATERTIVAATPNAARGLRRAKRRNRRAVEGGFAATGSWAMKRRKSDSKASTFLYRCDGSALAALAQIASKSAD